MRVIVCPGLLAVYSLQHGVDNALLVIEAQLLASGIVQAAHDFHGGDVPPAFRIQFVLPLRSLIQPGRKADRVFVERGAVWLFFQGG